MRALGNRIDVAGESEGYDIRLEPVDDGARLRTRPAMRAAEGDRLAGFCLPVLGERLVECGVEFARRIIGDV